MSEEKTKEQRQNREANSRRQEDKTGAREGTQKWMKFKVGRTVRDKQPQSHLAFVADFTS